MYEWWPQLLVGVVLLFFVVRGFRTPNTRIDWATLANLMRDEDQVDKYRIHGPEAQGADLAAQFRSGRDNVKYFRSFRGGNTIESLDVYRRGEAGFIVTFYDGIPKVFQRIAGRRTNNPAFAPSQETALRGLLDRFRRYAKAWPET